MGKKKSVDANPAGPIIAVDTPPTESTELASDEEAAALIANGMKKPEDFFASPETESALPPEPPRRIAANLPRTPDPLSLGGHPEDATPGNPTCTLQVFCPLAGRFHGGAQGEINKAMNRLGIACDKGPGIAVLESNYVAAGYVVFIMHGHKIEALKAIARSALLPVQGEGYFIESTLGKNGFRQSKRTPIEG